MYPITHYTKEEFVAIAEEAGFRPGQAARYWSLFSKNPMGPLPDHPEVGPRCKAWASDTFPSLAFSCEKERVARDGTIKFLFRLQDGALIETVLMDHFFGKSLCITSQVGCNMGCAFCASGGLRKQRNLALEELWQQIIYANHYLRQRDTEAQVSHVVVMGIGEPFDNYENVMKLMDILKDPQGPALSPKHLTISTCGLVPGIIRFADAHSPVRLALSLHAPFDDLRKQLMPVASHYSLEELMDALQYYFDRGGKRVAVEYILLAGLTDTPACSRELSRLLRPFGNKVLVNLIPYNEVIDKPFRRSSEARQREFKTALFHEGVLCKLRAERGRDVDAACGQLRSRYLKKI